MVSLSKVRFDPYISPRSYPVDETGWQVGSHRCYTWAFSTTLHVLFRCGVSRGKAEAQAILGEQFAGIGVTDDYGAYQSLFSDHQLCWAHLLRKAIKLMLQHPKEPKYQTFLGRPLSDLSTGGALAKRPTLECWTC